MAYDAVRKRRKEKEHRTGPGRAKHILRTAKYNGRPISDSEETIQWFIDNQKTCQICGRPDSGMKNGTLFVDHDHETGKVRGMLCHRCNMAAKSAEHAKQVLAYLQAHESGFAEIMRKVS